MDIKYFPVSVKSNLRRYSKYIIGAHQISTVSMGGSPGELSEDDVT